MRQLELLAPARDKHIGIAAIDCGADAVYIAGEQFGARQAAGNPVEDIRELCDYAHKFGARIFITLNTILYEDELARAYDFMLKVQEAGADAIIVQDLAVVQMAREGYGGRFEQLRIPLHASTQCAVRTPEQARFLEGLGFSRLILERELSLEQIRAIRQAVSCELEFFVHGALCVCYSGQCYLSELIADRSANRGACIQACRSRYDLVDASGKVLVRDKALLSLKDYNLRERLLELAEAGITSFKIEGRLKNESYVRNVVRDYSLALDRLVGNSQNSYCRGSFGSISGGFAPDTSRTFNRGYTELFIDGVRGKWAAMDAAKSMGEHIGTVTAVGRDSVQVSLKKGVVLGNADGFSYVARGGQVEGFRGDVCSGSSIRCKVPASLFVGAQLYRNINAAFEKEIQRQACVRGIGAEVSLAFSFDGGCWALDATAISEDGRKVRFRTEAGEQTAENAERMAAMIETQINKGSGHYRFTLARVDSPSGLPLMKASALNEVRRRLAEMLDGKAVICRPLLNRSMEAAGSKDLSGNGSEDGSIHSVEAQGAEPSEAQSELLSGKQTSYKQNISNSLSEALYHAHGASIGGKAFEIEPTPGAELMRTKYCIRHELGICPLHHDINSSDLPKSLRGIKAGTPLFLLNNGKRLALHFDCRNCEMVVKEA
ncbi:MAG: U32 family peptidase [Bacteroidales bacterium]|nr:U32 family peptidase [Bacteroidales bacterium]